MSELKGNLFSNLVKAANQQRKHSAEESVDGDETPDIDNKHSARTNAKRSSSGRRFTSNSGSHYDSDAESRSVSPANQKLKDYPLRSRCSGQWIPYKELLKGNSIGELMRNTFYNPSQYTLPRSKLPRKRRKLKIDASDSSVFSAGTDTLSVATSKTANDTTISDVGTEDEEIPINQKALPNGVSSSSDDDITLQDLINMKKNDERSRNDVQDVVTEEPSSCEPAVPPPDEYEDKKSEQMTPTLIAKNNSRLWCICKKPWDMRFMISCDRCHEWYHGECVGITKDYARILDMRNEDFICSFCKAKAEEEINRALGTEPETPKREKFHRKRKRRVLFPESSSDEDDGSSVEGNWQSEKSERNEVTISRTSNDRSSRTEAVMKKRNARLRKIAKQESYETEKRYHCLFTGCQNWAFSNSVYCSQKCIQQHIDESLKILHREMEKNSQVSGKTERITVIEKSSGRILSGENAPYEKDLYDFLCVHSTFEILKPGAHARLLCGDGFASKNSGYEREKTRNSSSTVTLNKTSNDTPKTDVTGATISAKQSLPASVPIKSTACNAEVYSNADSDNKGNSGLSTDKRSLAVDQSNNTALTHSPAKQSFVYNSNTQRLDTKVKTTKSDSHETKSFSHSSSSSHTDTQPARSIKRESKPEKPVPLNPMQIRINVRRTLRDFLKFRVETSQAPYKIEEISEIAVAIEDEMYKHFGDTGAKYKQRYRTLVQNIKDKRNNDFFMRIVAKEILPPQLMVISAEEMASNELALKRKEQTQKEIQSVLRAHQEAERDSLLFRPLTITKKDVFIRGDDDLSDLANQGEVRSDTIEILPKTTESPSLPAVPETVTSFPPLPPEIELPPLPAESPPLISDIAKVPKSSEVADLSDIQTDSLEETYIPPESPPDESTSALYGEGCASPKIPKPTNSRPLVWKGLIFSSDTTKFFSTAYKLHGNFESISQSFPDKLVPCGRTVRDLVWEYVSKIMNAPLRDFLIVYFLPASSDDKRNYASFFQILIEKKKCAVLSIANQVIRDVYLVPLAKHECFPSFLSKANVKSLPPGHPDLLIGLIITNVKKVCEPDSRSKNVSVEQPVTVASQQSNLPSPDVNSFATFSSITLPFCQLSSAPTVTSVYSNAGLSVEIANSKSQSRDPRLRKTNLLSAGSDGTSTSASVTCPLPSSKQGGPVSQSTSSTFTSGHIYIPPYPPPLMYNSVYVAPSVFFSPDVTVPPPAFVPQSAFWSPPPVSSTTNCIFATATTTTSSTLQSEGKSGFKSENKPNEAEDLQEKEVGHFSGTEKDGEPSIEIEINKNNVNEEDRQLIDRTVSEIMECMEDRRIEDVTQISVRCLSLLSTDEAKQSFLAAFSEELKRLTEEIASSAEMDEQESSLDYSTNFETNNEMELQDNLEHVNMDLDEVSTPDSSQMLFGSEDMDYRKDDIDIRQETMGNLQGDGLQNFAFSGNSFDTAPKHEFDNADSSENISSCSSVVCEKSVTDTLVDNTVTEQHSSLQEVGSDVTKLVSVPSLPESFDTCVNSQETVCSESVDEKSSSETERNKSLSAEDDDCVGVSSNESQPTNVNFHEVSANNENNRTIGGGIRFRLADRSQRRVVPKHFGHSRKEHDSYWDQDEYERDPEAFKRLLNYISQYPSSVFSLENANLFHEAPQTYFGNLFRFQASTKDLEVLPEIETGSSLPSGICWFPRDENTEDCDMRISTNPIVKKRSKSRGYVDLDKPND